MGIDGMSLPLYILTMVITLMVIIYSWNHIPEPGNPKAFFILILILQVGMAGTFVAQDLILFFVFFEVVLLPMYFMIGVWGGEQRQYASLKFFLFTLFGSAFMLLGVHRPVLQDRWRPSANGFSIEYLIAHSGSLDAHDRAAGSSAACSSASPSRCRCSRSTPGCRTPTPRRRPWAR